MHKWTIIFNTRRGVRGFSFSENFIFFLILFLGLLCGAFSYIAVEGYRNKAQLREYTELKKEKEKYLGKLDRIRDEISFLDRNLEETGENNTLLLLASELNPISKSVKLMGVGGFPERKEFYSDVIDAAVKKVESSINRVHNLLDLEKKSLDQSEEKLKNLKKRLAHTPSIWPTYGWVSDAFGWRIHPITHKRQFHEGFDIANIPGTPVVATADGVVTSTKWLPGYGNTIKIKHGYGFETRYAHLRSICVRRGHTVTRGKRIGFVGSTGRSTGSHLHYEIRVLGQAVDPYDYLDIFKNSY